MNALFRQLYSLSMLSNSGMLGSMHNKDNLPILESLLEKEIAQQDRLIKLKKGKEEKLSESKLEKALAETKGEVEEFLGVDSLSIQPCTISCSNKNLPRYLQTLKNSMKYHMADLSKANILLLAETATIDYIAREFYLGKMPLIAYGITAAIASVATLKSAMHTYAKSYTPTRKNILIPKLPRTYAIPVIAHEYTHHLQRELIPLRTITINNQRQTIDINALSEGMARGVERHISHTYMEREDNEMFLQAITDNTVPELKNAYANLCRHLNKTPNKELAKGAKLNMGIYSLGNAYFYLEETKNGKGVYRDALKSLIPKPI